MDISATSGVSYYSNIVKYQFAALLNFKNVKIWYFHSSHTCTCTPAYTWHTQTLTHAHTHTHTCTHTHSHTHTHNLSHTHTHNLTHTHTHTTSHTHTQYKFFDFLINMLGISLPFPICFLEGVPALSVAFLGFIPPLIALVTASIYACW